MSKIFRITILTLAIQLLTSTYGFAEDFVKNCKMGTCSWFKVEKREVVGQSSDGNLLKLQYKEWESYHPNAAYNKKFPRKEVGTAPAYMFCSLTRPAVIFQQDDTNSVNKKWDVSALYPRDEVSISGVTLLSYMLYFNACHGIRFDGKEISFSKLAKKLGYPNVKDSMDNDFVTTNPLTLLRSEKPPHQPM